MKNHWLWHEALHEQLRVGHPLVLVTVLSTAGSTPRDAATKMVISEAEQWDTIGGGHLEYQAVRRARELLALGTAQTEVETFELGANLGQCCGGATRLLFEVMVPMAQSLAIYGAGHVAQHLIPILKTLDLRLTWIDSRAEWLPQTEEDQVRIECTPYPVDTVADLPEGAWVLILTHNHQLDFELVQAALRRPDLAYIGVIGSDTKARRFRQRLEHRGWSQRDIARVTCPIGLTEIPGKRPAEVALSIAGQMVQRLHLGKARPDKKVSGLAWKTGRELTPRLQAPDQDNR